MHYNAFSGEGLYFFRWHLPLFLTICLWANFQPYRVVFDFFGVTAFAFFVSLTVLFEFLNHYLKKIQREFKWGLASLALILIAFLIWNLSRTDSPLCDPYSPIQGHAIWHVLDAASVYCLFRFYVSEDASG
ncbi:MAG: hypothetical protein KatS3mg031_0622 [Chitinophagales bacterium]|nr:MAG: hypothetical protein KatS3mg031_0622 [Chitinophagales bacterium]